MPDSELFKVILNGGFFGLFALFFVWLLFKAEPNHRASVEKLTDDHRKALAAVCEANSKNIETQVRAFQEVLAQQLKECREERREMQKEFQGMIAAEFELNRVTRHESVNTMLKAIREVYREREQDRERGTGDAQKR